MEVYFCMLVIIDLLYSCSNSLTETTQKKSVTLWYIRKSLLTRFIDLIVWNYD